jgi:Asp-tRNA(Asn)/Glu-tRNA(Gln) amidotransferase A subunit family amidase
MQAEAAAFHAPRFPAHADRYQEKFRATLAAGSDIAARDYVPALRHCRQFRRDLEPLLARFDAILSPVAPGPAPRGIDSTGDASFCAPWSYAGVPAIALPSGIASSGLPLGVQLSAGPWQEAPLLAAARWIEGVLAFRGEPSFSG